MPGGANQKSEKFSLFLSGKAQFKVGARNTKDNNNNNKTNMRNYNNEKTNNNNNN